MNRGAVVPPACCRRCARRTTPAPPAARPASRRELPMPDSAASRSTNSKVVAAMTIITCPSSRPAGRASSRVTSRDRPVPVGRPRAGFTAACWGERSSSLQAGSQLPGAGLTVGTEGLPRRLTEPREMVSNTALDVYLMAEIKRAAVIWSVESELYSEPGSYSGGRSRSRPAGEIPWNYIDGYWRRRSHFTSSLNSSRLTSCLTRHGPSRKSDFHSPRQSAPIPSLHLISRLNSPRLDSDFT